MNNFNLKKLASIIIFGCLGLFSNAQNLSYYYPSDGMIQGGIYAILEDHNSDMWFGSWTNPAGTPGLVKYNGDTWEYITTENGLVGDFVRQVFEDNTNNIWIATTTGISKWDGVNFTNYTSIDGLLDDYVYSIFQDDSGNMWFGSDQGLSMFDGINWIRYDAATINPSLRAISTIIQDQNGDFWFGTTFNGIVKYDGLNWTNITVEDGLAANQIYAIHQDTNNNIWVGAYDINGGISKFDGSTWTIYTIVDGLADNRVRAIHEDIFGDLWFGTNKGLTRYDDGNWINYDQNNGLIQGGVRSIMSDGNNNLWVGHWLNGVYTFNLDSLNTLGIVGNATPGGWIGPDIDLTYNEALNTFSGNITLTDGEIKFRYDNNWTINFGDNELDNTLDPGGANIPVTAGTYFVKVDLNAMTYSLQNPYVTIPDQNFEQALIDLGIDGNIGDPTNGSMLRSDAEGVTDLNVNGKEINSLSGLEAFVNLSTLYCQYNQLSGLDVTQNTALTVLECEGNQLTELNVTQNPLLRVLGFGPNNMTEIDVSQNLELELIWTNGNQLSSINLDANTKLTGYGLSNNPYTYVSLKNGNNKNVTYFEANDTPTLDCINADEDIINGGLDISSAMMSSGKTFSVDCSNSIAGRWIIAPEPGALKVGPEPFSDLWWALNKFQDDIAIRACYLDDVYEFGVDGSFKNILGDETFLEAFQLGVSSGEECGSPVFPHDGSANASYQYNQLAGTITLNGKGAYLGLAKPFNGGELDDPNNAPESITYDVSFSENGNVMTLLIEFGGSRYWTFKLIKESVFIQDSNFEQALIDLNIDSDGLINKRILRSDAEAVTELNLNVESLATLYNYGEGTGNPSIVNVTDPILNLTGIEAFVNLNILSCGYHALTDVDVSMLTKLEKLELANNQLIHVDVSTLTSLKFLNLIQNQIADVDVTNNSLLELLWLETNLLTDFGTDISQNTKLKNIAFGYNAITSLDVSNNLDLIAITAEGTQIETIDVSNNLNLRALYLFNNLNFSKLDVSKNSQLTALGIFGTSVEVLDLSNNTGLTRLFAFNNLELSHLDMRNGNNEFVTAFNVNNTPSLTCINVNSIDEGDISPAMLDALDPNNNPDKTFSVDCGDFVYIPDPNFEQSLIDIGVDTDGVVNTSILRKDAETITSLNLNNSLFTPDGYGFNNPDIVNVSGKISDLTGIEAFVNLTNLQVSYSELQTVNVSANVLLEELWITDGILTAIDVTANTNLVRLGVMRNNITGTIDVSQNTLLEWLFIFYNSISTIDLSNNPNLWNLWINNNAITSLDISLNPNLQRLDAQYNLGLSLITDPVGYPTMTSINLSGNGLSNYNLYAPLFPNVKWLLLNDNNLDKFNGNNALLVENLFLNNNQIVSLNLSTNTALKQLHAKDNLLTELDVRNGNNLNLTTLDVSTNLLTCISVDDPTDIAMPFVSWNIDSGVIFSDNCKGEPEIVLIPDPIFEQKLIGEGVDQDGIGLNGSILLSDALATTDLDVNLSGIVDMTGIEAFENLVSLNASFNNFNEIDLTNCTELINLDLSFNNLTSLVLTSGKVLTQLNVGGNNLVSLNLEDLTNLTNVDLSFNEFESIDASALDQLLEFSVHNNNLSTLDMRNGNNTAILNFSAENNPNLFCIGVDDPVYSSTSNLWNEDISVVYNDSADCQAPNVITQNFSVYLDRNGLASITPDDIDNGSFDNVTLAKDLVYSLDIYDFDCSNLGDQTVNLMVTDAAGNSASTSATVSVIDEELPTAKAIRTYVYDLEGGDLTLDPNLLDDGSTDNCAIANLSLSQSYFTLPGTYYVDLIVQDASGNESSDQVEVEIIDSVGSVELKFGGVTVIVNPNPFDNEINLSFSRDMNFSTVSANLTDFNGNSIDAVFSEQDSKNLKASGLSVLLPGPYILNISVGNKSDTAIMIKN